MGNETNAEKIVTEISQAKKDKICKVVKKLQSMSHVERFHYFQKLPANECNIISEIVLNFLKGRIQPDYKSFSLLKRCRKQLKQLASKKIGLKTKRKILHSLHGLQIISIIITLVKTILSI